MGFPLIAHAATLSVRGASGGGVQSDLKINGKIIVSLCVINNAFNAISAKM